MRPKCARACSLMLEEITASVSHPTAGLRGDTARPSPDLRNPPADGRPADKDERGRRGGEGDRDVCASLTGSRLSKKSSAFHPAVSDRSPLGARPGRQFCSDASRAGLGPPHARFLLAPRARRLVGNGGKGGAARTPTPRAPRPSRAVPSPARRPHLRFEGWGRWYSSKLTHAGRRGRKRESRFSVTLYPPTHSPILGNLCETIEGLRCVTR